MRKKLIAAAFVLLGVGGVVASAAPNASALDIGPIHVNIFPSAAPCVRADFVVFGTDIGPLPQPVCL